MCVVHVRVFALRYASLRSAALCYAARTTHFISFHFISFHFISFHFISFHFISFHFISFHFISFHFISFHFISFHFISFHFISFHFISFHFISFHFISFHFFLFHFISFHFISFHFISFHFISFHFISFHSHTSLVSEPRRLRVYCRAGRACDVSECARMQRALGVCAVVHVVTHFLSRAWGDCASESLGGAQQLLHPNPKGRHTPTAGRDHINLRHTFSVASLPPTFPGGEAHQESWCSTA